LRNFTLSRELGEGGQGKVYLAKLNGIARFHAVKVVEKTNDSIEAVGIERDMLIRNGEHHFLLTMDACFCTETFFYFVTPLCSGGDLFSLLCRSITGKVTTRTAGFYLAEIAIGLNHLHSNNIVHRDLKLANIFIKQDGHICIGDFGLANTLEGVIQELANSMCGTITHVPPEILRCEGYTKAADWWAFGVMAYHLLHGELPFDHADDRIVAQQIVKQPVVCAIDLDPVAQDLIVGVCQVHSPRVCF
ncbi:kinase-like domain-containing protein, partial [Mycena floridula]